MSTFVPTSETKGSRGEQLRKQNLATKSVPADTIDEDGQLKEPGDPNASKLYTFYAPWVWRSCGELRTRSEVTGSTVARDGWKTITYGCDGYVAFFPISCESARMH